MEINIWYWIGFNVFVLIMLILDLGVFHRKEHEVKVKEALIWTFAWISLALVFNYGIYHLFGKEKALEFLTGYLIEKSLSVDNIFIFILIFSYFNVPSIYQHKILFWGILGALVMRAIFIFAGIALINQFHWIIYLFAIFLVFTGIKMLLQDEQKIDPDKNPVVRLFKKIFPVTKTFQGSKFFVKQDTKTYATPLFIVLLMVEVSDLIFAVDSIPAILAITNDPFIVYTSNAFAILGLRSLYFALAGMHGVFRFLKVGLSLILIFIGIKMFLSDIYPIPIFIALIIISAILLTSIIASLAISIHPSNYMLFYTMRLFIGA
ncbi:TerC family protein [Flavobacterium ovatum]|uniref:TerC family protein n=1 Tax=Flavobacterium ovatum TaxID=1928857 RepID=UPI003450D46E